MAKSFHDDAVATRDSSHFRPLLEDLLSATQRPRYR
jgi:hypothetical protein